MPTEMKKNPSSSPSNGAMSASSSWRYSEPDSSTPAMNAPSDIDSPASAASSAVPATISSDAAVNNSGVRAPPIDAEQRRHHEAPADQDDGDREGPPRHVVPREMIRQTMLRQQRHQRDQRNERQVLKQQHREPISPRSVL